MEFDVGKKISISSLACLISLPGVGLFLLLKQHGPMGLWKIILLGIGIAYVVVVSRSFTNLFFGIVVAQVSFVSTLLWYSVMVSESDKSERIDAKDTASMLSILASVSIPVIVFQIVASGSSIFENVSMDPCASLMRSWLAVVICLSVILLFGRQCYWQILNWFEASFDKKAVGDATISYVVMGLMASMIIPFFLSDFPNPIRILFCMFW